jgi:hypothetical protein
MELKIEDLMMKCIRCEGAGKLENPAMNRNRGSYGSRLVYATPIDCDKCNGKGSILTESGKTLIEFFQIAKAKHFIY